MPSFPAFGPGSTTLGDGSSTTSWRTSGSSCTSDGRPAGTVRLIGIVRLAHPFPSLVNAVATAAIAFIAAGAGTSALRLGAAMLAFQASIGALNDLVDAPLDSGRKPGKPLPRGAATVGDALGLAVLGLAAGLALSAPSGVGTAMLGATGLALGYAYDLRLSRTAWSWLPLALALPLVPAYAWLGSTGEIPPGLVLLVPVGLAAGLGLALANGLADLERDASAGVSTPTVRLGRAAAWRTHAAAMASAVALAWWLAPRPNPSALAPWAGGVLLGTVAIGAGAVLAGSHAAGRRERGWELEAVGVAVLGIAWVAGIATI